MNENGKHPQALSLAFKRAASKIAKLKELGIDPQWNQAEIDTCIEAAATAKAKADGSKLSDHVKGQRFYIEGLVAFSKLNAKERLEYEYKLAFADAADEDEMLAELEKMSA